MKRRVVVEIETAVNGQCCTWDCSQLTGRHLSNAAAWCIAFGQPISDAYIRCPECVEAEVKEGEDG